MDDLTLFVIETMRETWPDLGGKVTDVDEARQIVNNINLPSEPLEVLRTNDITVPSRSNHQIPVRIYLPLNFEKNSPAIIYFHGGGWVLGGIETHDHLTRELANATNAVVISVDYRLAPEHHFPIPLEDCADAVKFVFNHCEEFDIDVNRIAVGGDSAGGNLSAAICLMAKEGLIPMPMYQLLICPVVDADFSKPSYGGSNEFRFLTKTHMIWYWDKYIPEPESRKNPLATPLNAKDLSGLPEAYIATAEHDPLLSEGEQYARKLEQFGNKVTYRCFKDLAHGFSNVSEFLPAAKQANDEIFDALRCAFWDN